MDPNNPNVLWLLTNDIWKSTDGGTTFFNVSCALDNGVITTYRVHSDQHALAFVGNSSSNLLAGNDGGVFFTANADVNRPTRPTFRAINTGFNANEFYGGDITDNRECPPAGCNRLVAGTYRAWESTDAGTTWSTNSGDLTRGGTATITRIYYAKGDNTIAVAGTTDGKVQYGFNLGESAGPLCRHSRVRCQYPRHARPCLPGDLHGQLRHGHLGRQERQLARHPDRLDPGQPAL